MQKAQSLELGAGGKKRQEKEKKKRKRHTHAHTESLSLSLSLTHTHTNTHTHMHTHTHSQRGFQHAICCKLQASLLIVMIHRSAAKTASAGSCYLVVHDHKKTNSPPPPFLSHFLSVTVTDSFWNFSSSPFLPLRKGQFLINRATVLVLRTKSCTMWLVKLHECKMSVQTVSKKIVQATSVATSLHTHKIVQINFDWDH